MTSVARQPRERGFAAMDSDKQREIAKKGGEAVSRNREHMAAIGRRGGEARGEDNHGYVDGRSDGRSDGMSDGMSDGRGAMDGRTA